MNPYVFASCCNSKDSLSDSGHGNPATEPVPVIIAAYIVLVLLSVVLLSWKHMCFLALLAIGLFAIAHVSPLVTVAVYLAVYIAIWVLAIAGLVAWFKPSPRWKK